MLLFYPIIFGFLPTWPLLIWQRRGWESVFEAGTCVGQDSILLPRRDNENEYVNKGALQIPNLRTYIQKHPGWIQRPKTQYFSHPRPALCSQDQKAPHITLSSSSFNWLTLLTKNRTNYVLSPKPTQLIQLNEVSDREQQGLGASNQLLPTECAPLVRDKARRSSAISKKLCSKLFWRTCASLESECNAQNYITLQALNMTSHHLPWSTKNWIALQFFFLSETSNNPFWFITIHITQSGLGTVYESRSSLILLTLEHSVTRSFQFRCTCLVMYQSVANLWGRGWLGVAGLQLCPPNRNFKNRFCMHDIKHCVRSTLQPKSAIAIFLLPIH